jgi:cytochrome b561
MAIDTPAACAPRQFQALGKAGKPCCALVALFLSGWMHDSAWKAAPEIKMYWFGLFEWPRISWIMELEPVLKEQWHEVLGEVHEIMGKILLALFVLHVGGALKHQFIDKHPELQRMWR